MGAVSIKVLTFSQTAIHLRWQLCPYSLSSINSFKRAAKIIQIFYFYSVFLFVESNKASK